MRDKTTVYSYNEHGELTKVKVLAEKTVEVCLEKKKQGVAYKITRKGKVLCSGIMGVQ